MSSTLNTLLQEALAQVAAAKVHMEATGETPDPVQLRTLMHDVRQLRNNLIRLHAAEGVKHLSIAMAFGISPARVSQIVNNPPAPTSPVT